MLEGKIPESEAPSKKGKKKGKKSKKEEEDEDIDAILAQIDGTAPTPGEPVEDIASEPQAAPVAATVRNEYKVIV